MNESNDASVNCKETVVIFDLDDTLIPEEFCNKIFPETLQILEYFLKKIIIV